MVRGNHRNGRGGDMKPDGGPAFPTGELRSIDSIHEIYGNLPGMTLRDYFAAKAMQGFLANRKTGDAALHNSAQEWVKDITEAAFEFADAMLEERNK